jgi:hypothetical protein
MTLAAFSQLRDRAKDGFLSKTEARPDAMGRPRQVEVFSINPRGPYAPTE